MSWRILASRETSPPFAKWVDMEAAESWREAMRVYLSRATSAWARSGGDEPTQWRRVRDYFVALSAFGDAIIMHPCDVAWYGARRINGVPEWINNRNGLDNFRGKGNRQHHTR